MDLLTKLEVIKERHIEVGKMIVDPEVISDMKRYIQLNKEYKDTGDMVKAYEKYKNLLENRDTNKEILDQEDDAEMIDMAKEADQAAEKSLKEAAQEHKQWLKIITAEAGKQWGATKFHEVHAGDQLSHRVFHLQPCVHLEEVKVLVPVHDEFDRAGRGIIHRLRQGYADY